MYSTTESYSGFQLHLQNKFPKICLNAPRGLIKNCRMHNDTGIPFIIIWIKTQYINLHPKLNDSEETINGRPRPRLTQDILLLDTEESLSEDKGKEQIMEK